MQEWRYHDYEEDSNVLHIPFPIGSGVYELTQSGAIWKRKVVGYHYNSEGKQAGLYVIVKCDCGLTSRINTSKKANWVKSEIPHEAYVCSLCGGACWHYDSYGLVVKSNYCPNCGAQMYDEINKDSIELRFKACLEELIDIAKQSESPSEVLKIVGDNFLSLAKGFECIERTNEDRYQKTLIEIIGKLLNGETK